MKGISTVLLFLGLVLALTSIAEGYMNGMNPPFFDIAKERPIHASATCGESVNGNPEQEEFCNLSPEKDLSGTYFLACGHCEKGADKADCSAKNAVDPSSALHRPFGGNHPHSLGDKNIMKLMSQLIWNRRMYEIAYVHLRMANSPRPNVWVLERSSDNGKTFQPLQYFAPSKSECEFYFGPESILPLSKNNSLTCDTKSSGIVPLGNGEVFINLMESQKYFESERLQLPRATHIRLRFLRMNLVLGHIKDLMKHNPAVAQRYFYSVKKIEVAGRCVCNGLANSCSPVPENQKEYRCACENNTCGNQCQTCCPGFDGYPSCKAVVGGITSKNEEKEMKHFGKLFSN